MELGMIGLGRMGANMAERLVKGGHKVSGFDPNVDARKAAEADGIAPATSLEALVAGLSTPRVVWLMVPAGKITDDTVNALLPMLNKGDTFKQTFNVPGTYKYFCIPHEAACMVGTIVVE